MISIAWLPDTAWPNSSIGCCIFRGLVTRAEDLLVSSRCGLVGSQHCEGRPASVQSGI